MSMATLLVVIGSWVLLLILTLFYYIKTGKEDKI